MKSYQKAFCAVFLVLAMALAAWKQLQPTVASLVIAPEPLRLAPGETFPLHLTAYTRDGGVAGEKAIERLSLVWEGKSDNAAFTVSSEGVVTGHSPGIGNVWVRSADEKLNSRAITVYVA